MTLSSRQASSQRPAGQKSGPPAPALCPPRPAASAARRREFSWLPIIPAASRIPFSTAWGKSPMTRRTPAISWGKPATARGTSPSSRGTSAMSRGTSPMARKTPATTRKCPAGRRGKALAGKNPQFSLKNPILRDYAFNQSDSLSSQKGGEGRGEEVNGGRPPAPLTPTLSPLGRGEGVERRHLGAHWSGASTRFFDL